MYIQACQNEKFVIKKLHYVSFRLFFSHTNAQSFLFVKSKYHVELLSERSDTLFPWFGRQVFLYETKHVIATMFAYFLYGSTHHDFVTSCGWSEWRIWINDNATVREQQLFNVNLTVWLEYRIENREIFTHSHSLFFSSHYIRPLPPPAPSSPHIAHEHNKYAIFHIFSLSLLRRKPTLNVM